MFKITIISATLIYVFLVISLSHIFLSPLLTLLNLSLLSHQDQPSPLGGHFSGSKYSHCKLLSTLPHHLLSICNLIFISLSLLHFHPIRQPLNSTRSILSHHLFTLPSTTPENTIVAKLLLTTASYMSFTHSYQKMSNQYFCILLLVPRVSAMSHSMFFLLHIPQLISFWQVADFRIPMQ